MQLTIVLRYCLLTINPIVYSTSGLQAVYGVCRTLTLRGGFFLGWSTYSNIVVPSSVSTVLVLPCGSPRGRSVGISTILAPYL